MQAPPPGARSWAGVCGLESVTVDPVATRATVTQAGSESSGLRARGAACARWALWARTPRCFQPVRGGLAGGWALRHTSAAPPAPSALSGAALPCSALLPAGPPGMRVRPVCEGLPSALLASHCVSEGAPRGRGQRAEGSTTGVCATKRGSGAEPPRRACSPGVGCGRGWGCPHLCPQLPQPLPLPWLHPPHLPSIRQGLGEGSWDLGDRRAPRAQAASRGGSSGAGRLRA